MKKVNFHFNNQPVHLRNRRNFTAFIENIFKRQKKKLNELHIVFCSDKELLDLNRMYLKHNFLTDILTFDLSESDLIQGELYISYPRVRENASIFKSTIADELHRTIIHGVLHLCGLNDKTQSQKRIMDEIQESYLKKYKSS